MSFIMVTIWTSCGDTCRMNPDLNTAGPPIPPWEWRKEGKKAKNSSHPKGEIK